MENKELRFDSWSRWRSRYLENNWCIFWQTTHLYLTRFYSQWPWIASESFEFFFLCSLIELELVDSFLFDQNASGAEGGWCNGLPGLLRVLFIHLCFIFNAKNEGHSMPEQPGPAPKASSAFSIIHLLPLLRIHLACRAGNQINPNKSAKQMLLGLKPLNGAFRCFRKTWRCWLCLSKEDEMPFDLSISRHEQAATHL